MPRGAVRAMLQGLLGVVLARSLCWAMLMPNITTRLYSQDEGSADDPNTHFWPGEEGTSGGPEDTPPWPPSLPRMHAPIKGLPMPPANGTHHTGRMMESPMPPDYDVCNMLLSMQPPLPPEELPFFCLCSHCKGTPGPKGDRGDQGPPGAPGSPGMRGMMGMRGRPGFTGPPGSKGQKGDLGQKGEMGSTGFTGMKGARGYKGEKGDRGSAGPQGEQGPQGESGTCPASCQSVEGPPGAQGPAGPPGARGLPGVKGAMGSKGLAGDKGDMGMPGEAGMHGMKGDRGEKGVCECSDGADGMDGRPGDKGAKGGKGEDGAMGETGPMGMKGAQGEMGPMGMPGPCSPAMQSAFSACTNESYPRPNWPVPFPHVLSNQQGHFDPLMGIYTAPVNGTYVFSYHLAVYDRMLKVGIFVNFYPKLKSTEAGSRSSTSQLLVLHLSAGDRVWLQVKSATTNGMFTDAESSSTFTGHLLHADSCDMMPMMRHHHGAPHTYPMGAFRWEDPDPTTPPPQ